MDSDTTWFRIDMPDIPLYFEPIYHFLSFILSATIVSLLTLIVVHSAIYITMGHPMKWEFFFFGFSFANVAWFIFNGALIYALTLSASRGLMSTWIFIFATCAYAALMKWMFGTIFIGLDTLNYWLVLIVGGYISGIAELSGLFRGTLSTALTYRI
jgi:hypothetical protein